MGLKDWKFAVLLVLVVGAMVLLYVNAGLAGENGVRRAEVTERQQFIDQTVGIGRFSARFIQDLARLAAEVRDEDLRRVLADNGVTFTVEQPAPEAADQPETEE